MELPGGRQLQDNVGTAKGHHAKNAVLSYRHRQAMYNEAELLSNGFTRETGSLVYLTDVHRRPLLISRPDVELQTEKLEMKEISRHRPGSEQLQEVAAQ